MKIILLILTLISVNANSYDATITDKYGRTTGYIKGNVIVDKYGKTEKYVQDGRIKSKYGKVNGYIKPTKGK